MEQADGQDDTAAHGGETGAVTVDQETMPGKLRARFHAIKEHKWRGRFLRLLCITDEGFGTQDDSFTTTNFWTWASGDLKDVVLKPDDPNSFTLHLGQEEHNYSTKLSVDVLSQLHNTRAAKCPGQYKQPRFQACKVTRGSMRERRVTLEVQACQLRQLDPVTKQVLSVYEFKTIKGAAHLKPSLEPKTDQCIVIERGNSQRQHIFKCPQWKQLVECLRVEMKRLLGLPFYVEDSAQTAEEIMQDRNELPSAISSEIARIKRFEVFKSSLRSETPKRKVLLLSNGYMIELDAVSQVPISARNVSDVVAIVRQRQNTQWLRVEHEDGSKHEFAVAERDMLKGRESLAACLLDEVKAAKANAGGEQSGRDVTAIVRDAPDDTSLSTCGREATCHLDVEKSFLSLLAKAPSEDRRLVRLLLEFGVHTLDVDAPAANEKKRASLLGQLFHVMDGFHKLSAGGLRKAGEDGFADATRYAALLKVVQSLVYTRSGYEELAKIPDVDKLLCQALQKEDLGIQYQTIMLMVAIVKGPPGARANCITANKKLLLSSYLLRNKVIDTLGAALSNNCGQLIVQGLMSYMAFCTIKKYADTTDPDDYKAILEDLAALPHGKLFKLFLHPSMDVVHDARQMMEVITRDSPPEIKTRIQSAALHEGAVLHHLHLALFAHTQSEREISRTLVAMWCDGNQDVEALLGRVLPNGLVLFLDATLDGPQAAAPQHHGSRGGLTEPLEAGSVSALRSRIKKSRNQGESLRKNWMKFWTVATKDHELPDLIWNADVRDELRVALEQELTSFAQIQRSNQGNISVAWNHHAFYVTYPSLMQEKTVGSYFLRLLLSGRDERQIADKVLQEAEEPRSFFNDFFCRCLIDDDPETRQYCLHAVTIVYRSHHVKLPLFHCTEQLVAWLAREDHIGVRDHLLCFLRELIRNDFNARNFLLADGISLIVELMTLVHWNEDVHSEPSQSERSSSLGNFYYKEGRDSTEQGPMGVGELERAWSEHRLTKDSLLRMDTDGAWVPLPDTRILRWRLMSVGKEYLTTSTRAGICLDLLLTLAQKYPTKVDRTGYKLAPLPAAKRKLSDHSTVLCHVAQVLLSDDPSLIDKACRLLSCICKENLDAASKLYQTGAFFFALMCGGPHILEIVRLFKETHMLQLIENTHVHMRSSELLEPEPEQEYEWVTSAGKNADTSTGVDTQPASSFLASVLPEALVYKLENTNAEEIADIFTNELDTPELVWNMEMREHLRRELTCHVTQFCLRLRDNPLSQYTYAPMPSVTYKQLEHELWCCPYYLRNLCDMKRFPRWPIRKPADVLQSLLAKWVQQQPNNLGAADTPLVQLFLDAQIILYMGKHESIRLRNYSGYSMLLHVLALPTGKLALSDLSTLVKALHLALATVRVLPSNALELIRNNGVTPIVSLLHYCLEMVDPYTDPTELALAAATHALQIIAVLVGTSETRAQAIAALLDSPTFVKDICLCMDLSQAVLLTKHSLQLVAKMGAADDFQRRFYASGAHWRLLPMIFTFDSTSTAGAATVDWDDESTWNNEQQIRNVLAAEALRALQELMGGSSKVDNANHTDTHKALVELLTPGVAQSLLSGSSGDAKSLLVHINDPSQLREHGLSRDDLEVLCDDKLVALMGQTRRLGPLTCAH